MQCKLTYFEECTCLFFLYSYNKLGQELFQASKIMQKHIKSPQGQYFQVFWSHMIAEQTENLNS